MVRRLGKFVGATGAVFLGLVGVVSDLGTLPEGGATEGVPATTLVLRASEGRYFRDGAPFTGWSHELHGNGRMAGRTAYVDGRKHGMQERWFEDGSKSFSSAYHHGRQHGVTRTWWRNGNLRSESRFEDGVPHGSQMQWYASGAKFKRIQLDQGRESGLQQSWRENGKLYNNYEARDGRIFGLKRSKLCFKLDDETIQ